jgi:gamma-glutamyl:cysteine ligase YbdK (ATP-grasp superfamily)
MKFGLESEKMIYDLKEKKISHSAQRMLQGLEDYKVIYGDSDVNRVTGEFVHSMIEMASSPTADVFGVVRDYLISYGLVREVAERTGKRLLPVGSYPLSFQPTMVSKWEYYVKNAILSNNSEVGWELAPGHGLFAAANCAGVHVHAELETQPQFHPFSNEIIDKHNLAVALIPLCAFSSSPYFEGVHEAKSMRAYRYFFGIYEKFATGAGIPPMFSSSLSLLRYYLQTSRTWVSRGESLGFDPSDLQKLTVRNGANWGMVRWNYKWNTIEMRCFDTDLVGMDLAKFTLASRALKRADLKGEHLHARILLGENADLPSDPIKQDALIKTLLPEIFEVTGSEVTVLPTVLMHRLIYLSVTEGLSHPLVYEYIGKIIRFASYELDWKEKWVANVLTKAYFDCESTSDWILKFTHRKKNLRREDVDQLILELLKKEDAQFEILSSALPKDLQPPKENPFHVLKGMAHV